MEPLLPLEDYFSVHTDNFEDYFSVHTEVETKEGSVTLCHTPLQKRGIAQMNIYRPFLFWGVFVLVGTPLMCNLHFAIFV